MKKAIFASIAVAMLTACSNDEVVLENNDANAIRFGVTAQNNSRAADVFCNNNLPSAFNVSAVYNNALYINGDNIEKGSNGKWENKSGLRYWPNAGEVHFYGYVNGDITMTDALVPTFANFTVVGEDGNKENKTVADQVDLLYAVKTQAKTPAGENGVVQTPQQVNLNFRHALSQIVFNACNDNANLYVEISGVSVVNVMSKGTYTFPTANTDNNYGHADATLTPEGATINRGSWLTTGENPESTLSTPASYTVSFNAKPIAGDKNVVDLTTYTHADGNKGDFYKDAMLLLPQTTSAIETDKKFDGQTGTYFLVNCLIKNVAGETVAPNDVILWGATTGEGESMEFNGKPANVLLPVDFNWEEGKKYTYTFVFGNGNGGFDPDPNDPTPDPVLVPITFNVTVDEFIPVNPSTEIETGKLNSNE